MTDGMGNSVLSIVLWSHVDFFVLNLFMVDRLYGQFLLDKIMDHISYIRYVVG